MNWMLISYSLYLLGSVFLTIWVGRHLHKNGFAFIIELLRDVELSKNVNNILLIGFYLVNIAYSLLVLKENFTIHTLHETIELLSYKLGLIITILSLMHYCNIGILYFIHKKYIHYEPHRH